MFIYYKPENFNGNDPGNCKNMRVLLSRDDVFSATFQAFWYTVKQYIRDN